MSILKHKQQFFNTVKKYIPQQLQCQFAFGWGALSTQRIDSVRGSARRCVANFNTAKSKAYRLLDNRHWLRAFPTMLGKLNIVNPKSRICLDFSTFGCFQVLTFAQQTKRGRAIPVYAEVLQYPITEDSQNIFVTEAIERFVTAVDCRPKLVMDRGFACPHIIKHLCLHRHKFVVRVKGMKQFRNWQSRLFKARGTGKTDQCVLGYEHQLRLVISDDPNNGHEPWYLITNDKVSSRETIINDYYHRFEIEEFFKDAKWLLGMEHVHFQKIQSIRIVLWFVLLGWWCMAALSTKQNEFVQGAHPHDRISWPRLFVEALAREERCILAAFTAQTGSKTMLVLRL